MVFEAIAAAVVSSVVPYLAKKGEKLADEIIDDGIKQRGKIWDLAKSLFQEDELTLLNLFEENPDDAKTQGKVEVKIEDKLKAKPEVAKEFETLLKQIPAETTSNSVKITGDSNKVAQGNSNSTITIS